jgi:pimeloyl-ACP methyl ester carboxylesterase
MVSKRLSIIAAAAVVATSAALIPSAQAEGHTVIQGSIDSVPEPGSTEPVVITYTIYKPDGASAEAPVPMVLHSHGWGGSRTNSPGAFDDFNDAGLAVLSFDQRGFGTSGGQAHIEDPDFEGQDVNRLVDAVDALDWVAEDEDGPVLAAIGGSYGGGYQFVGAFTDLMDDGINRFDALAPEITWWDLPESLAPSGVVRSLWVSALYAAGASAVPDEIHEAFVYGAATGQWPDGEVGDTGIEGEPNVNAFFENNGPRWHVENGRQLDIPVLFGQGLSDNLFNLNQGLKNWANALTPAAQDQSLFVGYNGGHALPSVFPTGSFDVALGTATDPCSPVIQGGEGNFRALTIKFFRQALLGESTLPADLPPVHLATNGGACLSLGSIDELYEAVDLGTLATPVAAGAPLNIPVAAGPITVAGTPWVDATVTSLGLDARAFFALSVGTTPADARIIQNNMMPLAQFSPIAGEARSIELPAIAVEVPAGQSLFLTISPVSDMSFGHGSRVPGAFLLESTVVRVPVPLM